MTANRQKIPLTERQCKRPGCGKSFSPYRAWQEFCSPACRTVHYWKTHAVVPISDTTSAASGATEQPVAQN